MALAQKIDTEWQRREIICAWISLNLELGDSPKALDTMRKLVDRKADLHLEHLLLTRKIPSSDPVTVCRHIADYLTESGYAKYQIGRASDTIIYRDWNDCVEMPILPWAYQKGLKVTPNPSTSMFHAALRKLCNLKAETIRGDDLPKEVRALTPPGWTLSWTGEGGVKWHEDQWTREYWLLSPLK
ncbi:MAG: hypothetical protein HYY41_03405 [Chloroflexi bacterium]|nr:hypothetical protein [Chloroflexota bacterium]